MMMRALPAVLLMSIATALAAQDLPDRPIRRGEVIAAGARQFSQIDADHDGVVTRQEFDRFHASPAGQAASASSSPFDHIGGHWFEHADPDGRGRVTLQMAEAHPLELFDMADVNHDGVVGRDELRVAQAMRSLTGR